MSHLAFRYLNLSSILVGLDSTLSRFLFSSLPSLYHQNHVLLGLFFFFLNTSLLLLHSHFWYFVLLSILLTSPCQVSCLLCISSSTVSLNFHFAFDHFRFFRFSKFHRIFSVHLFHSRYLLFSFTVTLCVSILFIIVLIVMIANDYPKNFVWH